MKTKNTKSVNQGSSVDAEEIERFSRIAEEWWDTGGKFAPLHSMNPVRIEYIKDMIIKHFVAMDSLSLLDIGCGGGLIAEPMARLGAKVTAIDASEKNIKVAGLHAEKMGLAIDYRCTTAEDLATSGASFDVVLSLEIVEHVADIDLFIKSACKLLKPDGIIILSTLNRTVKSYALAIVGAEYIMRMLPVGTHTWNKFLRPSELCRLLEQNQIEIDELMGMVMNPISWKWRLDSKDLAVNYLVVGKKKLKRSLKK
ncbi:MAG: bifunctional 2-polyprenyl-6-hydroxyphenol methylase/3-demethylubiquinol 3-O-methyltransferase UbiG [Rickettsiales bacterium]